MGNQITFYDVDVKDEIVQLFYYKIELLGLTVLSQVKFSLIIKELAHLLNSRFLESSVYFCIQHREN